MEAAAGGHGGMAIPAVVAVTAARVTVPITTIIVATARTVISDIN
jgi:hypothetical protein